MSYKVILHSVVLALLMNTANRIALASDSVGQPGRTLAELQRAESGAPLMRGVIERYTTDSRALERYFGDSSALMSEARWQRLQKLNSEQLTALEKIDFENLSQDGRIDYLLLRNKLRMELKELEHERTRLTAAVKLIPFAEKIVGIEEARRARESQIPETSAKLLSEIDESIGHLKKELEKKFKSDQSSQLPDKVVANRAARMVDSLRSILKHWHEYYASYDPDFTWWLRQPFPKLDKDLKEYATFLRQKLAGFVEGEDEPVLGDPIGREALLDALAGEMIPYTPEELIEIANREFAWCDREMKRAASDLGFDGDWHKALDQVSNKHQKPGEQPRLIKELAEDAINFLEQRNLVTIPELCKETWRIEMMTPERQKVNPYFTGGEVISVSFPTDDMSYEDKLMTLRGNNISFCRATVHHELIPGHHLQIFMGQRYNTHRRLFNTPFMVEGWPLYWEMLLWDLNFARNAEDRVGMLFWRSHRCARIIFSLNFHLGKMTAPQAIDFLVERVGHERRNATAEVRRSVAGDYGPLYQAAYLLGGLQLRALRHELVDAGKMTDRQFHDAVLRENSIPVEMVRANLAKQPLTPDFKSNWRFYNLTNEVGGAKKLSEKPNAGADRAQGEVASSTANSNAIQDRSSRRNSQRAELRDAAPAGEPRVYRDKVEPHWFANGARFWYRNDLAAGEREFVLVDVEKGIRQAAFDQRRVAEILSGMIGKEIKAQQLPIESIEFSADEKELLLRGDDKSWALDLESYRLTERPLDDKDPNSLEATDAPRPSRRTGPDTEVTFVNKLAEVVELFWITPDGERQSYGVLRPAERRHQHTFAGHVWLAKKRSGEIAAVFEATEKRSLAVIDERSSTRANRRREDREARASVVSPDGKWEAFVRDHNLWLRELPSRNESPLSFDGAAGHTYQTDVYRDRAIGMNYDKPGAPASLPQVWWSPDSRRLVALRTRTVPERTVYLIESSPKGQLQPKLQSYPYLKPGDDVPTEEVRLFDMESKRLIPLDLSLASNPWDISNIRWSRDSSRFTFQYNQRGHQALRIVAVDISPPPGSRADQARAEKAEIRNLKSDATESLLTSAPVAAARAIVDEHSDTFICYSGKFFAEYLDDTGEIIWMSERDGWNHLYLYDAKAGVVKNQITKGEWVVRGVEKVDKDKRQIWFRAGGIRPEQDPYYIHYCRVNFDGTGLTVLTDTEGTHQAQFSPDRRFFIDTWSRVDLAPITELHRSDDGKLICKLEEADVNELVSTGSRGPERFVAKGRDGVTDIYGVIWRPNDFDPARKYPVIESIYAGPHDSFVPKAFRASYGQEKLTKRGFIVVQIDGMGTSNRSKRFHDVCWKNIGDAGFPDRMAWIKAVAAKYPYMDLTRVGIYGTSAGGQNALGGLLQHGEFYKAGVADCGCHDNRMDKVWWNEQWMGWPVGPHYGEQSNVTLAPKLQGKLLLMVGELDKNVDPASTMQVVNALVKADKDFEMFVMPGADHGVARTAYGWKRIEDFFVRAFLEKESQQVALSKTSLTQ